MNTAHSEEQGTSVVRNGEPMIVHNHSASLLPTDHEFEELREGKGLPQEDEPPVVQIERDLDELTYSGAAINDLEIQLTRTKRTYQNLLVDGQLHVEMLRRKLHSHIVKSEPFITIWRKARQVQDMSNRAAARYDKANSQHTAAKEMIRVAESQLAACKEEQEEQDPSEEPTSPSPLDLAWQEMLNHATAKVVVTERERRDSEIEHRKVLDECKKIMDEYRAVERKLRTHIVKSRPYFQERYRINQQLAKMKDTMKHLEQKISESKRSYSASLKRLEVLNTEMHQRRGLLNSSAHHHLDPRQVSSTGTSPEMRRARLHIDRDDVDNNVASVDGLQSNRIVADYSGSTGSLPSIGVLSNSEMSLSSEYSDTKSFDMPLHNSEVHPKQAIHRRSSSQDCIGHTSQYHDMVSFRRRAISRQGVHSTHCDQEGRPFIEDLSMHQHLEGSPVEPLASQGSPEYLNTIPACHDQSVSPELVSQGGGSSRGSHWHDQLASPNKVPGSHHDHEESPISEDIGPSHKVRSHLGRLEDVRTENSLGSLNGHPVSNVASDLVVRSLATALSRLNQEHRK